MKHLLIAAAAVLSVLSTSTFAFAQDDMIEDEVLPKKPKDWFVYADANIATTQFSDTDGNTTSVTDSGSAAYFRAGVKYKFIGAEVELGQGLSDIDEGDISFGVSSQTSVFAILRTPRRKLDVFLRVGYHSSKVDFRGNFLNPNTLERESFIEELDSDGLAAGVGGTYYFSENFGLRADVTGYNTGDIINADYVAASIGGSFRF